MRHVCASCGSQTSEVMDFGRVALAGAFLKPEQFASEQKYPLTLRFCEECYLVQVGQEIPGGTLFDKYFYHSSATATMKRHFEAYARKVVERLKPRNVLEIGCNDGVLLRPLLAMGLDAVGVDPAGVAEDGLPIIRAHWPNVSLDSKFGLILANNVFAHIADINAATAKVAETLSADGSFVFEVNRLDSLVLDLQYDWIYHEHRYYYSLLALDKLLGRHGLEVYDLTKIATHAGSMRYFAARKGTKPVTKTVEQHREHEKWAGLQSIGRFRRFAQEARDHREIMQRLVSGKDVAGYGACGRTNTMLQFCGLDSVRYIVDDAPAKQGFYTPGTHVPIVSARELQDSPPEMVIVFAWSFFEEIRPKLADFRGEVVIPLPHIYRHKERAAA